MKYLYAPWRDRYFSKKTKRCIFCKPDRTTKKLIFLKGKYSFCLVNLYPYTTAHVMVAPFRHISKVEQLKKEEILEIWDFAKKISQAFYKLFKCQGINFGINQGSVSGAGFEKHIHLHIVARWKGDVNFMTSVSGARVVSSDPVKISEQLKKYFKNKK
ncbi:MAG: HIT domain-containing protein [Elusimicrobia bacterium]|nr:HIT domain-containing protein [Elusimicrobiota bacterium]